MSSITSGNAAQYGNSEKLAARARLHKDYTVAETGWFEWLAQKMPFQPSDRVLDIGCGPGWFWAAVAGALPEKLDLTLADLSPGMVQEAQQRCQALPFGSVHGEVADATALPFEDGAFDAVIAMHMVYHLKDQAKGIAEMHRVLKPGGFLAITTNGTGNMRALYALATAFGGPPVDPAAQAFGYEQAEQLMRARFGNVTHAQHPARLRITEPEDIFMALTSYPPGDGADAEQLSRFRAAIAEAFERGGGLLETDKEMGLFISRKDR